MAFTTQIFLFIFFPLCFITYYIALSLEKIKKIGTFFQKIRLKDLVIIVFSCGFYMWACFDNIFRLLVYIAVVYLFARITERSRKKGYFLKLETEADEEGNIKKRRIYLAAFTAAAAAALLIFYLAYYKYTPMFNLIWKFAFGENLKNHSLMAPLGLSFITFSAISYITDIYRGKASSGSVLDCALYMLFFPKIVSGPIVLWQNFQKQIKTRAATLDLAVTGINRIVIGFAKKVILADTFGSCIASMGTGNVDKISAAGAVLLYMLQIYYDFAGYSDIAIGLSNLFGFEFDNNFNFPYRSKSISEFWRRWHISLGAWFKEYVYIPLGGSRAGLKTTLRNLFIVFLLTGIWHGNGAAYIFWGLINAAFVIIERVIKDKNFYKKIPAAVKYIFTMFVVMCFWQLFRFSSISQSVEWFKIIFGLKTFDKIYYTWQYYFDSQIITFTVIGILGATVLGSPKIKNLYNRFAGTKIGYILQEIVIAALFILVILFIVNSTYSPFIYFQY